jgi:simple sugar transport system ATP-binding protein
MSEMHNASRGNAGSAPEAAAAAGAIAIAARGIVKRFGALTANDGAEIVVADREIHALVGENGAGKSTLMRILSGLYVPDAGAVEYHGADVTGWSTSTAISSGVGMVHQHFMLVPTLTVAENVVLGHEIRRGPLLDRAAAERAVADVAARSGLDVPVSKRVSDLTVGEAQRAEIVKTLYRGARLLILDEPTAVLSPPEVQDLWRVLRRLRDEGTTVVVITHKLDEVMEISDRITVMRHGRTVDRMATADATPAMIARSMVGRDVSLAGDVPAARNAATTSNASPVLELRGVGVARKDGTRALTDIDLTVHAGEIVGIAGVEGNGQTELIEAIAGLTQIDAGAIVLNGGTLTGPARERSEAGIAHVPEDRHARGLVLEYDIADNLILGRQREYSRSGVLDRRAIRSNALAMIEAFDIRPATPEALAGRLSGGNQQKIVIAREMTRSYSLLLAAQPTRGVDVGAIEMIHRRIRETRDNGKAVLLVSADLTEVLALADRIAVLYKGRIAAIISRAEASESILGEYMTGVGAQVTA